MSKKHYHLQLEQFPLPCLRISRVEFQQVLGPRRFDKTLTARGTSQATAACWAWISQLMAIQVSPGRERRWCRGCSSRVSWQFVGACKIDSLMSMGWPTQQKKNGGLRDAALILVVWPLINGNDHDISWYHANNYKAMIRPSSWGIWSMNVV